MWRYFVGALAALLLVGAGLAFHQGQAAPEALPPPPPAPVSGEAQATDPLPAAPRASDRTREEKRFDRYDKDRDNLITLAELHAPRRKAFAKLDRNGDGRLSFEEWAIATTKRFEKADADKSRSLTRAEFATTAPKRKPPSAKSKCDCKAAVAQALAERAED